MTKLKRFLWAVVFIYCIYAMIVDGPSVTMAAFLGLAVIVCVVQECVNSTAYKKWKNHEIETHRR
ncbi:MAG: hypothetical protein LKF74_01055 [Megasphaera sp.]|nr:hypothetical protein [Megasphaera sp.]MCH4217131.1 hypothetical protein [Megasphaera sp.]